MTKTDLGFKNLLVSGCSFTHNYFDFSNSWPWYLRDLTTIENVIDCSCPGAGNTHIQQAVVHKLETDQSLLPSNTLIIVMWSGYDRDDVIVDPAVLKSPYPDKYHYSDFASLGMSGGLAGESNLIVSIENLKKIKNRSARAIDNYVRIISLYYYLKSRGFCFVFTEFSTAGTRADANFNLADYLEESTKNKFIEIVRSVAPNLGDYALQTAHQSPDGYHPASDDHREWTEKILLPYVVNLKSVYRDPVGS